MELSLRKKIVLEADRLLHKDKAKEHPLRQLFWECTQRCNISCLHCGSDCKHVASTPDMPAQDFLRVIDGIKPHVDSHKVSIIITGGEPLVRKDLEAVGLELYKREFPWGIVTNGLLLDARRIESLRQAGLHALTISLDGQKDDHNWLRGHPQSYDRAINAISLMAKVPDVKWDIVTCVHQRNLPHLQAMYDMLSDIGVRNWRLFTIFPVGRAAQHPELQLTPEQYRSLLDTIKRWRAQNGGIHVSYCCEGFLGRYEGEVRDYFYRCDAGISVASIRIDGSISGCLSIRSHLDQGNIYRDDFWEVWQQKFEPVRDREWMRQGQCADCSFFRYCKGNGMHLRAQDGTLLGCNLHRLQGK